MTGLIVARLPPDAQTSYILHISPNRLHCCFSPHAEADEIYWEGKCYRGWKAYANFYEFLRSTTSGEVVGIELHLATSDYDRILSRFPHCLEKQPALPNVTSCWRCWFRKEPAEIAWDQILSGNPFISDDGEVILVVETWTLDENAFGQFANLQFDQPVGQLAEVKNKLNHLAWLGERPALAGLDTDHAGGIAEDRSLLKTAVAAQGIFWALPLIYSVASLAVVPGVERGILLYFVPPTAAYIFLVAGIGRFNPTAIHACKVFLSLVAVAVILGQQSLVLGNLRPHFPGLAPQADRILTLYFVAYMLFFAVICPPWFLTWWHRTSNGRPPRVLYYAFFGSWLIVLGLMIAGAINQLF